MKTGLVLEGGGMRGIYTVGVLDVLLDNNIHFDYIIGVSAGAGNAASYISGQRGRGFRVNTQYVHDKRYIGIDPILHKKSVFGLDFIYDTIPQELDPFDYDAFFADKSEFVTVVTDAETGKAVYFDKDKIHGKDFTVLKASAALPMFTPPVEFEGRKYFDGGVADSIPVQHALDDGCDRLLIVRTRPRDYVKKPERMRAAYTRVLKDYPNMIAALDNRYIVYNESLALCDRLQKEGRAVVIAPEYALPVDKFGTDKEKLEHCYYEGMRDCKHALESIETLLSDKA